MLGVGGKSWGHKTCRGPLSMGYKRKLASAAYKRAGPRFRRAYRNFKRGRTFYSKNKSSFRKAGRILRRRLPRQKRLMKVVGDRPYSKICKVFQIVTDSASGPVNRSSRVLYSQNITARIPKQTTADEPNLRDQDVLEVKGVKIDYLFKATQTSCKVFNMALIIPKDSVVLSVGIPTTGFFRGYGTSMEIDFQTPLTSHDMTNRPINSDRYDVLWRKKFVISHLQEPDPNSNPHNIVPNNKFYKRISKYIPINRQFRNVGETETHGRDPWLVYWCDDIGAPAGTAIADDQYEIEEIMRIFYNDHQM